MDSSYATSRSTGKGLNTIARAIANAEDKARSYDEKARAYRDAGRDDTNQLARAKASRDQAEELRREYQSIVGSIGETAARQAVKDAPKNYFSGYEIGSGRSEQAEIRLEQSRSFTQARELSKQQAGVYQYRSGGAFISQASPGSFRNERGELVTIREPVGSSVGGGFLYPSVSQPRSITGLNLFDPQTQAAVRERAGSFETTGGLFGSAMPQSSMMFTPIGQAPVGNEPFRFNRSSAIRNTIDFFGGPGGRVIVADRALNRASDEYVRLGGGNFSFYQNPINTTRTDAIFGAGLQFGNTTIPLVPQPARTVAQSGVGVLSGVLDIPNQFAQNPYGTLRKTTISAGIGIAGGAVTGVITSRVAARSLPTARFLDVGTRTVFGGLLAYQTATDPVSVGRELPFIVAGAAGFQSGFSSTAPSRISFAGFEQLNKPSARTIPQYFTTETSIRPQTFVSVGRGRARFDIVEYGQQRTATSDILSVTRGGRSYSQNTGRPTRSYTVEQVTSFEPVTFQGREYAFPSYQQRGYIYGKETAFVDNRGIVTLSRQARNVPPSERVGLTRIATQEREYAEAYQSFGIRFQPLGSGRIRVQDAFTRANVETGFGFDQFRLSRSASINTRLGDFRAFLKPSRLGSRSEGFEFTTILGREKDVSGSVVRQARPFESVAIRRLQDRGFLGSDTQLFPSSRRGQLSVMFGEQQLVRPSTVRYTRRSPRVQFYPEVAPPRLTSVLRAPAFVTGLGSAFRSTQSSSSSLLFTPLSSSSVTDAPFSRSLFDVTPVSLSRSSSILDSRSLTRTELRSSTLERSFFDTPSVPVVVSPPPELPFPPGVGVPLFGPPGGGGVEGRGRQRGFKYAPSVNSILFNVRGRKPTKPLGGFETRPILTR